MEIFHDIPGISWICQKQVLDESWSNLFVTFRNYCQQLLERSRKKMRAKDHTRSEKIVSKGMLFPLQRTSLG